eukprot:761979-Hanusia_phi.AAC.3
MAVACGPLTAAIPSFMRELRGRSGDQEPPAPQQEDTPGEVQLRIVEIRELLGRELGDAYEDAK